MKSIFKTIVYSFVAAGVALFVTLGVLDNNRQNQEKIAQYVKEHSCVVTGFAGRDANRVYKCDNGMRLGKEMY